jgi:hypothetical protein
VLRNVTSAPCLLPSTTSSLTLAWFVYAGGFDDIVDPSVLSGDLEPLLDVPHAVLAQHLGARNLDIERLVQAEARSLDAVSDRLKACDFMPATASRPPSPTRRTLPSLPCFGLGLKRQRSMGSHVLTDEAVQKENDAVVRCAAAVGRIAKHQDRR